ncbi:MAG: hydroxyacylglutathione hydrolase [Candidatus Thiodiazotropha sp. (ex Gloverina cf. vestifex)]|nr:hydroxyacylglutathione hydrolase [Candidatus Thiodiazotropha sp. (ex Gloverina cf. vestifex)]
MLEITPVSAFDDNYIWMLGNPGSKNLVAVDPGDEIPVLTWLNQHDARLCGILITHHHYDHVGGVPELLEAFPDIPVYGPAGESIRGVTVPVGEGDVISIKGLEADLQVLDVPGHTAGHIAYYGEGALFCGDTLFAAGCGRVFDGTFEQLADSLQRISDLPGQTQIYCAHEYTLDNLGFATWVEPESTALQARIEVERVKRESGNPTLPALLEVERETNPFLRTAVQGVKAAAERSAGHPLENSQAIFTALRQWKGREYD